MQIILDVQIQFHICTSAYLHIRTYIVLTFAHASFAHLHIYLHICTSAYLHIKKLCP